MKLYVLLATLGLSLLGCTSARDKSLSELFNQTYKSAVRILLPDGRPHGSGFVLQTNRGISVVITNEHVCDGMPFMRLKFEGLGGIEVIGIAERSNSQTDLCLILIPHEFQDVVEPLKMVTHVPLRSDVYALGYPLDNPLALTQGMVLGPRRVLIAGHPRNCPTEPIFTFFGLVCVKEQVVVVTTATIHPGNSGSPALNIDGDVVGVFNSASSETHFGNMIPLSDLQEFIKDI